MKNIGIDSENLDTNINPKDDFYHYACGGWQRKHPLKGEYSSFGTFNLLAEEARENVRHLIENLSSNPQSSVPGTIAQKVNDLYKMGLDSDRRRKEGIAPILPILDRIEKFTKAETDEYIAWLAMGLDSTFFGYGVGPDPGNSDINTLHLMEPSLSLGDRDYYLEESEVNQEILNAYGKYIVRIMSLAGYPDKDAVRIKENVIAIEKEYARYKKTREERRDPQKSYNPMTIEELESNYPSFGWRDIFSKSGLEKVHTLNVSSPKFMEFINGYYSTLTERQIKDLMAYGAVSSSTGVLPEEFYEADFEMFDKTMGGAEEKKPLWKRAMSIPNSMFGEAIGQLYVEKFFPEENKKSMLLLVDNLKKSLQKRISGLGWMEAATKNKALEKLDALKVKIGYPDKWKDYSEIVIDPGKSYLENVLSAAEWFTRDNFKKMGRPVDKDEWHMTPQTVNAYYSPLNNEICFPAGILQPPFFNINAGDAVNYGAIGVVIGHEMTHGFDDSGRKYDSRGNLSDWWTEHDKSHFEKETSKLVSQFDSVKVAENVHANGLYTLGENIADQGGLLVAFEAWKNARKDSDTSDTANGFTPDQLFFLSYAGVWASNIREEEILVRTKSDPHSLAVNRVNVTLPNLTEFLNAFSIQPGDGMFRGENERVVIW